MVHCHEATFFFTPFKHGEVNDPKEGKLIFIAQTEAVTHEEAEFAKLLASAHSVVTAEDEDEVARLRIHLHLEGFENFGSVELIYRTLNATIFAHTSKYQPLSANLLALHKVSEFVKLLACINGATRCADTADVLSVVKHGKVARALHDVHQFHKLHAKAHIGLVRTEAAHSVCPGQAEEGRFAQIHTAHFLEEVLCEGLKCVDNIVLLYERHFAVNLREFGLTVGTEVFIAEALHDLEVAVKTCYHQQLLQRLRTLGKGIELTGIHA